MQHSDLAVKIDACWALSFLAEGKDRQIQVSLLPREGGANTSPLPREGGVSWLKARLGQGEVWEGVKLVGG